MALAANAAYQTTPPGFDLDTLSCHFVAAPNHAAPFDVRAQRLADSGRFCSRVAILEQGGQMKVHVTCSFVRSKAMTGPNMEHAVKRRSEQRVRSITLDDLAAERKDIGPYMKFQRLPLVPLNPKSTPGPPAKPEDLLYTSAAQVEPLTSSDNLNKQPNRTLATLALIALSDYHILDCPPTIHGLPTSVPAIADNARKPTPSAFKFMTSLNHNIRFSHIPENFKGDELVYVEAQSPWTRGRRGQVESRMFTEEGVLLATCVQETYYVMKEDGEGMERSWVMEKSGIGASCGGSKL